MRMFGTMVVAAIVGGVAYQYGIDEGKREAWQGPAASTESAPVIQPDATRPTLQRGQVAAANALDVFQHRVLPQLADAANSIEQALRHGAGHPAPHNP